VMGSVDKTIIIVKHGNDFLLIQIYVNDIIFGDSLKCSCQVLGNDRGVSDVHDGRTNLFLRYLSQANKARYLRTSSQVHEAPDEVQHG
jgi:hypothetical protein